MDSRITIKKADDTIWVSKNAGMVTGAFKVGDKVINPFYTHPWQEDEVSENGIIKWLQGDFICLPFGITPDEPIPDYFNGTKLNQTEYAHGYSSNAVWKERQIEKNLACIELDYQDEAIERIMRDVEFLESKHGISFKNTAYFKADGLIPIGAHPIFRLSDERKQTRLTLPECRFIASYPIKLDESSRLKRGAFYDDIRKTPLEDGGFIDGSVLPFAFDSEELIMLCDVESGEVKLDNLEEGYRITLNFNPGVFNHLILWISNHGRQHAPWSGRNVCIGIEPVTAAFDFGAVCSTSSNILNQKGVKTAARFKKGSPLSLDYQISIAKLD